MHARTSALCSQRLVNGTLDFSRRSARGVYVYFISQRQIFGANEQERGRHRRRRRRRRQRQLVDGRRLRRPTIFTSPQTFDVQERQKNFWQHLACVEFAKPIIWVTFRWMAFRMGRKPMALQNALRHNGKEGKRERERERE